MTRALSTVAVAFVLAFVPARALAFSGGVSGSSGKSGGTCTGCHAPSGTPPTVTLSGPDTLGAGATGTYTLEIQNAAAAPVGFDVAASDGTLATVSMQTQLMDFEITHTSMLISGADVKIQFSLTAPAQAEVVTLFAAGLRSDGHDDEAGDATGTATLMVTVAAAPPGADLAQARVSLDEPRWACSFSGAASASAPALLAACLFALALRRRRER